MSACVAEFDLRFALFITWAGDEEEANFIHPQLLATTHI